MASDNELLIKLGIETSSASKQVREITKELKNLEKQVKSVDKASDGYNSSLDGIGKKVDIYSNKLEALNSKLKVYEKSLEDATYQLKLAKTNMEELGKRTSDNAKDWDDAAKKLELAQIKYNNLSRSIQETELEIQNVTQDIRKLNDSFEDLKFEAFSEGIEDLNKDIKNLDNYIDAIDTSTDSFLRNINGMGTQAELSKNKIKLLNESLELHQRQLNIVKVAIRDTESWLESLGEKTEDNADEWNRASDYLEKYKNRQHELTSSFNTIQAEIYSTTNDLAKLNKELAKAPFDKLSEGFGKLSSGLDNISQVTQPVTQAVTGVGVAALTTAVDFESAMAKVQAVSGVSGSELELLSEKARAIGRDTQLSASEGAEALLLLAQAGYDTATSLEMVDSVVNLAIANELSLGEATEIVTSAINAFGLGVKDAARVTDVLSAVASSSNSNVSDLGEAFKAVAPSASALGFSVEDTALVLGLLANNAIQGSEAGNGLKSVLANLVSPTKNGAEALKELGVEITNSDGTMRDLSDIVKDLQKGFSGLSEEEQAVTAETIVGKQQMSKFLAIVNSGEDSFNNLSTSIEDSNGKTAEMREIMESTSAGGLKELMSKLEETFIIIGNKLLPVLNDMVDELGKALEWFQNLDEGTQDFILRMGTMAAIISPATSALSKLTGGLSSVLSVMGKVSGKIASEMTFKKFAGDIAGAAGVIGATGTGSFIGALSSMATAIAPWLIGGSIAVALGLGVAYIVKNYDDLKNKVLGISEDWDYGNSLMEEATKTLAETVKSKFQTIKDDIQEFEQNGISLLVEGMRTLNEDGTNDFSAFLSSCQTEMSKAKTSIDTNAQEITKALGFMNTDIATVFSFQDLATIQEEWSGQMTRGLETAYNNLETTITEKDAIIEGLMETHGYDFETAYDNWEQRVLTDYQTFCDALIEAQTGYQENSLGSLEQFLLEEDLLRHGDLTKVRNQIHDSYAAQGDQIEREYDVLLSKILQGETAIDGVKFSSTEQAMKYADMVRDYKIAQLEVEREKEIQAATELAYQKGIISKAEYEQYIKDSQDRLTVSQNEVDSLVKLIQDGSEGASYAWECTWEAIKLAEQQGIPASMIRNKEFTDAVTKYFEEGGTDMQEAITTAYDNITGTTEESRIEIEKELSKLDTSSKKNMDNVITYMNDMGLSLEDACKLYDIDTELMEGYIRQLASGVEGSSKDIRDEFIENTTESKTMTGAVAKNMENMNTRVMSALTEMDGSLIVTDNTMDNTGKTARNALPIVASSAEQMGTRVRSALVDTQGNFISTNGVVAREVPSMQNKINSLKGKEVDVTVRFKSIDFVAVRQQVESMGSHVYSAGIPSYKDAGIEPMNFGEIYTEDLYGLKDAGIKTISLANLENGISAYATKDSTASSMVANSVSNYNQSTSAVTYNIPVPSTTQKADNEQAKYEALIKIENMSVRNDNDIREIAKQLENYIRLHSKKW